MNRRHFLAAVTAAGSSPAMLRADRRTTWPNRPCHLADLVTNHFNVNRIRKILLDDQSVVFVGTLVDTEPFGRWFDLTAHAGEETWIRVRKIRLDVGTMNLFPFPLKAYLRLSKRTRFRF